MNKSIFVGMVISALASTGEKDILSVYDPCKELMEEWKKFLEKEAKGPYRDRRKLK